MSRVAVALAMLALAACKHAPSSPAPVADDCKVVHDDPAHAMAILSQRHPKDPVKVAQVIEGCVAPSGGDECTRAAALIKAIPQMAPALAPKDGSAMDPVALCRTMPPAMQHCMLASYNLMHEAECTKAREDLAKTAIAPVDIKPSTAPACDGGTIAVYVAKAGLWLATGKDARARCFAATNASGYDFDWFERQLHRYYSEPCKPAVELAAEHDVSYQDVVHAMDVAVKEGLTDVGMTAPADLQVPLATAPPAGAPAECPHGSIHTAPTAAAAPPRSPASATDSLKQAPVVVVTTSEIDLAGKPVVKLAELGRGTGTIAELVAALPTRPAGATAILQADRDTPSGVITRVIQTLKASGYPNVLFAVKNK